MSNDMIELKKEIIEARNQAIKTDNQVKNISLDVKGFEKRFEGLEKRTRMASVGAHAIVALAIGIAAFLVNSVRSSSYEDQLRKLRGEMTDAQERVAKKEEDLAAQMRTLADEKQKRAQSQAVALEILKLLDKNKDDEAADKLSQVRLSDLTELEQYVVGRRFAELRRTTGEDAYRQAKSHLSAGRQEQAVQALARSLALDPEGGVAAKARYLQATTLYTLKRWDQAEPILREIIKKSSDRVLLEEVRFLLGITLARLEKRDEAKELLKSAAGRYSAVAGRYLAALEDGAPLPGERR